MSLDPSAFIDTSNWVGEMGLAGAQHPPHPAAARRPARPPSSRPKPPVPTPSPEIESLEQMLEPERTGLHRNGERRPPWLVIAIVMVLLAVLAAIIVILAMR
jgi:hypothetical protein